MLRIFELNTDPDRYLCVQPPDLRYFRERFDGRPMSAAWVTPAYEILNRSKKVADFTSWQMGTRAFLVSDRARAVLKEMCADDLEFLPFDRIKKIDLFAVNVLRTEDYLDAAKTEFMTGIKEPTRVVWKPKLPTTLPPIFKVTGANGTYASAKFGDAAVEHRWTGVRLADPAKNRLKQIIDRQKINEFPGL